MMSSSYSSNFNDNDNNVQAGVDWSPPFVAGTISPDNDDAACLLYFTSSMVDSRVVPGIVFPDEDAT